MYRSTPSMLRPAAAILAVVAIVGFLIGHRHAASTQGGSSAEKTHIAYGASVLLEYPASWQPAAPRTAPAIPDLPITDALLLRPTSKDVQAGLLSGQITGGDASPLPAALLAQLHGAPHTEVVSLLDAQAYRYSRLNIPGYDHVLELYVIPSPGNSHAVLACYAPKTLASYLAQCQQIVSALTLVGRSPTDLTPDAGYASRLQRLIGALDKKRLQLRGKMRSHATPTALGHLAESLANHFATAARALATLEPPLPVGPTQTALTSSILKARDAYEALATAAFAHDSTGYATAYARVGQTEASVDSALQTFTLLGYSPR